MRSSSPTKSLASTRSARRPPSGSGFHDPLLLLAPRWQITWADGEGGSEPDDRCDGHDRGPRDHDHPPRGARAHCGERAAIVAVGTLYDRLHDSYCPAHGRVDEAVAAGESR